MTIALVVEVITEVIQMQVVIDIPERDYKDALNGIFAIDVVREAVKNGTPLPKGHGRLIDADVLVDGMEDDYEFCEAVNATPTIIEADGGAK